MPRPIKGTLGLLTVFACLPLRASEGGRSFVVARDGKRADIVVAADCRPQVRNAAMVLRDTLAQVTGASPALVEVGPEEPLPARCFVVGDAPLARRAGVDVGAARLRPDGFLVRLAGGRVVLSGVPERGPLYAVVDFLEREVGCRWFSGSRVVIPRCPDLTVQVRSRAESPDMQVRMPFGIDIWQPASRTTATAPEWGADPMRSDGNAHTFFLDAPVDEYFDRHPEWYSYHRGGDGGVRFREWWQFDYHNPELLEHVKRVKLEAFRGWAKDLPNLNLCQNDWLGWSEDPAAVAFDGAEGSVAASHVQFVNRVAEAVAKEFPDRRLITLAYLQTLEPPRTLRYAPNVTLMICEPDALWNRSVARSGQLGRQYLDKVRAWSSKSTLPLVWIYHMCQNTRHQFAPDVAGLQDDFRAYLAAGAKGYFAEIYSADHNTTYFDDLRAYLMCRLAWNADLDLDGLLRDFHLRYFGPRTGPLMLQFYHAATDGLNTFEPEAWQQERLDRMDAILTRAAPLAEDDYVRRRITQAQQAVAYTRLLARVGRWEVREGVMRNSADAPECEPLRGRFNSLGRELGEEGALTAEQQRFQEPTVEIDNGELALTVVPGAGGAVARIKDLQTGDDAAFVFPPTAGELVGGYQELVGFSWSSPGIRTRFVVTGQSRHQVTMESAPLDPGMVISRTVTLSAGRPSFALRTGITNTGTETLTRGLRTHPLLRNGLMQDNRFIYRTAEGRYVVQQVPVQQALSAGWGPTGEWALVNLRTNRGILWESPPVHNGHFVWASPFHGSFFACETFSEHLVIPPGETREVEQRFTILRDARGWCKLRGVALPGR